MVICVIFRGPFICIRNQISLLASAAKIAVYPFAALSAGVLSCTSLVNNIFNFFVCQVEHKVSVG